MGVEEKEPHWPSVSHDLATSCFYESSRHHCLSSMSVVAGALGAAAEEECALVWWVKPTVKHWTISTPPHLTPLAPNPISPGKKKKAVYCSKRQRRDVQDGMKAKRSLKVEQLSGPKTEKKRCDTYILTHLKKKKKILKLQSIFF